MSRPGRAAVFVDRDGTLIDEVGYLNHLDRMRFLPGAARAVRRLNDRGLLVLVVTNQSGLANRIFDLDLLEQVHARLAEHLGREGARLDGVYYCPHHPAAADPALRMVCDCRKPRAGLLLRAAREHGVDLSRSYMVGDTSHDLAAAREAGVTGVLVLTGYGRGELRYRIRPAGLEPAHVAEDLPGAVEWILAREEAS
jgi:D-glycero-D-manno-heptose 1,7-bisphosphate phosphatase